MKSAIKWTDTYSVSKNRAVLTYEQHRIPGVRTLARQLISNAIPSLEWHYHENAFEFSLATKGSLSFSTETSSYRFSTGDVFISFPDEIHGTNSTPITVGEIYWFQIDISDPEHFLFLNREAAEDMISQLKKLPHHIVQTESRETYPLLKNALSLALNGESPQLTATYLQLFIHLLITSSQKEQFRLSPDIGKTLDYILDNITLDFSLDELAALAKLSLSQYKQKFKKQIGISPRRFINQQKIEYSKSLLLEGMSVTDVAMTLGFTTSSYFSTVFKKYTLYTPAAYINAHRQDSEKP